MPLYEFECARCGHAFEDLLSASAKNPPCPKCNCRKTERLISAFARPRGSTSGGSSGSSCASCSASSCAGCRR